MATWPQYIRAIPATRHSVHQETPTVPVQYWHLVNKPHSKPNRLFVFICPPRQTLSLFPIEPILPSANSPIQHTAKLFMLLFSHYISTSQSAKLILGKGVATSFVMRGGLPPSHPSQWGLGGLLHPVLERGIPPAWYWMGVLLSWDWMGHPSPLEQLSLDRFCRDRYASCGLPQEDFLNCYCFHVMLTFQPALPIH